MAMVKFRVRTENSKIKTWNSVRSSLKLCIVEGNRQWRSARLHRRRVFTQRVVRGDRNDVGRDGRGRAPADDVTNSSRRFPGALDVIGPQQQRVVANHRPKAHQRQSTRIRVQRMNQPTKKNAAIKALTTHVCNEKNKDQSNFVKVGIADRCCHLVNSKSFFSWVGINCTFRLDFQFFNLSLPLSLGISSDAMC